MPKALGSKWGMWITNRSSAASIATYLVSYTKQIAYVNTKKRLLFTAVFYGKGPRLRLTDYAGIN